MTCIDSKKLRSTNRFNIIVNKNEYNFEIRNENFKFFRFFEKKNLRFSNNFIDKKNSNLKVFIFSILYFQNREHFQRKQYKHEKKTLFKNAQKNSTWRYRIFETIIIDRHECICWSKKYEYFKTMSNWSKTSKQNMNRNVWFRRISLNIIFMNHDSYSTKI